MAGIINAGRYEVQSIQKYDLFREIQKGNVTVKKDSDLQQVDLAYKVTLSEEGLNSAKALRAYADEHGLAGQIDVDHNIDEFNKHLHTRSMDMSAVFMEEIGQIADEISKEYDLEFPAPSLEEHLVVMSKAYDTVVQRIEDEFSNSDRETTYILDENGNSQIETKEDRLQELHNAYEKQYAGLQSVVMQARLQYSQVAKGQLRDVSGDELKENAAKVFMDAISEKNRENVRNNFSADSIQFSVDSSWLSLMNNLRSKSFYAN